MPSSGKAAIGRSAVTSMSTASVSHHPAIQTIRARVARPAGVNSTHWSGPGRVLGGQQVIAEQPQQRPPEQAHALDRHGRHADAST